MTSGAAVVVQLGHPADEQVAGLDEASERRGFDRSIGHADRKRDLAH